MNPNIQASIPGPELTQLLTRRDDLERRIRQPGGLRIIEERELLQLRNQLREPPDSAPSLSAPLPTTPVPVTPPCATR